ncbi:MAG: NAD(P)/FAD-dependent oxidoreductase [Xanthomonadaceae bacterium]|nr:NAD(P)/FAD-dependent oxidoreductase [Xanthomonadaceae bacterium]
MPAEPPLDALIVGAGFSGLCVAIALRKAGRRFRVLEQADRLGGTWRDNHYPGAACDVPSNLYCYSFAPNPDWSRSYPRQAEIQAYLERCVDDFGVRDALSFGQEVHSARFDESDNLWRVTVAGSADPITARALVLATGGLSRPKLPEIPGIGDFAGTLFHTARWPTEVALDGKRIGLIGTGASAIQIVPELAPLAAQLTVFQRTPPWIVPKPDFRVSVRHRAALRRWPALQRLDRWRLYLQHEVWAIGFTRWPGLLRLIQPFANAFRRYQVREPGLRARLAPDYTIGCKRVLLSNDYYPALVRENVHLETDAIAIIERDAVVTADGRRHACDALVLATGFHAAEAGAPFPIYGCQGRELNAVWGGGASASAYLGTTVSGFPGLFVMTGPNTALGHNSMVYMIEAQTRYVGDAVAALAERPGISLDVDPQIQLRYNHWVQKRLAASVWNTGGCSSWYRTASGLNTTLWPDFTFLYRHRTRRFDSENYRAVFPTGQQPGDQSPTSC